MSMYWWSILVILCYNVESTHSFPAYEIPTETETKSHSAITMDAIFRTTATFLDRMQLVNDTEQSPFLKVSNYFGSDQESFQRFIQIIQEISGYESLVKTNQANDSKYHVNGEQIEMAHILIKQIRNRIADFSKNTNIVKFNISLIREDVATILYIIQEFYSNTNWVELDGNNTIYEDFGQDNVTLKAVADSSEDTCTNCISGNGMEQCENNTIGSNLTSGYRSGQRITKPVRYLNGINGKCSHGTPDDTSRSFTATGGIYKGRSSQNEAPHSYLHSAAADAAVKATAYYLIDKDKGLLELIGPEVFRDIFGIRSREEIVKSSVTFVIDVESSKADISMIKKATEKIVNETKDSKFLPGKYVLVTFSDSANSTTGNSTDDFQTLISWLDNINVNSGGNCTESAMIGIRKGIKLSNNNSKIYIMTDARETNASLKEEVIGGLKAKNLNPIYILTGNCSRQSQEDVYVAIAKETGGKVFERTAKQKTVIETEIKEIFPSSNVFITWFKMTANSTQNKTIPVDEYTETLVITVTPVTSMSEVVLYNPNGIPVSLSANEQSDLLDKVLKISILNPESGQWNLHKNRTDSWNVNVTAQSALYFSASILEKNMGGNSYQLKGNPLKGNRYSVVVDIPNLNSTSTCSKVALLCNSGTDVFEFNVTRVRLNGITRYIGDFIPSNKSLHYIQIRGNDGKGNQFLRTRSLYIKPVSVQLDISPLFGNLRLNKTSNISFSLTKTDENFDNFVISVFDGNKDIDVQNVSFADKQVYEGVVMVTPTSLQTLILRFSITRENFTSAIQTKTRRYSVMDTQSAKCIVKQYPGMCPLESLNTENCTSYNWTGSVEISSKMIRDSVIKISTNEVIRNHMDLRNATFSVPIVLSGHCCIQTVLLTIIDTKGNFDECSFIVSEQPLIIVQYPSSSSSSTSSTTTSSSSTTTTTTTKQTTVAETSSYVTGTDKQTTTVAGSYEENFTDTGNSRVIGMALGFTFLGLTLIGIIICIVYGIKNQAFPKNPVAFLSYQTLKIKDENDHGVNEILDKCHELHNEDHVTTEDEINSSSLQECKNKENNDENNGSFVDDTDNTKEKLETAENKTSEADTINNTNQEKDTSNDDKKLTSIHPEFGTINASKAGPESSNSINGDKIKEDDKLESFSDHGQKDTSSLSSESNNSEDSQNLNIEKGNDLDSTVPPKNSCPANKQDNNENDQTTQVLHTGKDKKGTEESSKERNEEIIDLAVTNDLNQTLADENKSQV